MTTNNQSTTVIVLTCLGDREPSGVFANLDAVLTYIGYDQDNPGQDEDTMSIQELPDGQNGWEICIGGYTYTATRVFVLTKAEIVARNQDKRQADIVTFAREFLNARCEYEAAPSMGYEPNTFDEETGYDYLDRVYKAKAEALGFNFEEEVMPAYTDLCADISQAHDAEMRAMLCSDSMAATIAACELVDVDGGNDDVVLPATVEEAVHIDDHKANCDQCSGTEEVVLTDCSTEYYGSQAWLCKKCRHVSTGDVSFDDIYDRR